MVFEYEGSARGIVLTSRFWDSDLSRFEAVRTEDFDCVCGDRVSYGAGNLKEKLGKNDNVVEEVGGGIEMSGRGCAGCSPVARAFLSHTSRAAGSIGQDVGDAVSEDIVCCAVASCCYIADGRIYLERNVFKTILSHLAGFPPAPSPTGSSHRFTRSLHTSNQVSSVA